MCIIFSVVKLESTPLSKKKKVYGFLWYGTTPLLNWSCVATNSHGYASHYSVVNTHHTIILDPILICYYPLSL